MATIKTTWLMLAVGKGCEFFFLMCSDLHGHFLALRWFNSRFDALFVDVWVSRGFVNFDASISSSISRKPVRCAGKLLKIKSTLILIPFTFFVEYDFIFIFFKCCR